MGKIRKTASAKHEQSLSPAIRDFVKTGVEAPLWDLPRHLASFPTTWPFPRGDTYHWVGLLNRFDEILLAAVTAYGLGDGAWEILDLSNKILLDPKYTQAEDALPKEHLQRPTLELLQSLGLAENGDRILLESVLNFSSLLMDNCSNRALYASSAVLGQLLNCTSLAVIAAVLRLSLRLAARYSTMRLRNSVQGTQLPPISQPLLQQWYQLDLAKVEKLAMPFAKSPEACNALSQAKNSAAVSVISRTHSSDLISLLKDSGPDTTTLEQEYGVAWIDVSNASSEIHPAQTQNPPAMSDGPASPTPIRRISSLVAPSELASGIGAQLNSPDANSESASRGYYEVSKSELMSPHFGVAVTRALSEVAPVFKYELLCRMRVARAFNESSLARQQAVAVRLLAIANLAHIYHESQLQDKVLSLEASMPRQTQLPFQLRDLIHPPAGTNGLVPKHLQAIAVNTLEALTNHKTKAADVLACLNVNVGHGALTYLLRKVVTEMSEPNAPINDKWGDELRNALFSLLPTLPRAFPRAAESLASAGICEILVEGLSLRTPIAEENHTRILGFLDIFVYNTRDAFSSLVEAKGLDITAELLVHEVDFAIAEQEAGRGFSSENWTQNMFYKIPFSQQQILRTLFRFINHMMNFNGGAFDRLLRNLIESADVLSSLRKVVANPELFGTAVWSGAVSIFSNFLNAEPTSYAAIAEAGLTKTFLDTVTSGRAVGLRPTPSTAQGSTDRSTPGGDPVRELASRIAAHHQAQSVPLAVTAMETRLSEGILPSMEAIASVPMGFGSICLNDTGLNQLRESKALKFFFFIFLSSPHVKAMAATAADDVESLGAQFDELVRHHPRLKPDIIQLVWHMVALLADRHKHKAGVALQVRDAEGRTIPDSVLQQALSSTATSRHATMLSSQSQPVEDVEMGDSSAPATQQSQPNVDLEQDRVGAALTPAVVQIAAQTTKRATDVQYIMVYSKFLLGFFSNTSLVQPFSETPGIEKLIDFVTSPLLPYDFGNSQAAHKLAKLFHLFVENKPHLVLPRLAQRLLGALRDLDILVQHPVQSSFFAVYVTSAGSHHKFTDAELNVKGSGSKVMQKLLAVQVLGLIFAKCLPHAPHRNAPNAYSSVNLTDLYVEIVDRLGKLQTRCIWESILLEQNVPRMSNSQLANVPADANASGPANAIDVGSEMHSAVQSASAHGPADDLTTDEIQEPATRPNHSSAGLDNQIAIEQQNLTAIRHLLNHIPANISMSLLTIGKSLLVGKRPITEQYHKQNAFLVAEHIGHALFDVLRFELPSDASAKASDYYRYISASLVTQALMARSDTPSQGGPMHNVLSAVVQEFRKVGGLHLLGGLVTGLFERSVVSGPETLEEARIKGPKSEQRCSYEGMQTILRFFVHLTDHKVIEASPQTIAMARQERDKSSQGYFSAAQFVVELRAEAVEAVRPIWEAEEIDQANPVTLKNVSSVLKNVLEGLGEHGAIQRNDKIGSRDKPPHKHWKIRSTEHLTRLVTETGVDEELAREALFRCVDAYAAAKDYCIAYKREPHLSRNPIPAADLPPPESAAPETSIDEAAEHPQGSESPSLASSSLPVNGEADIVQQLISHISSADSGHISGGISRDDGPMPSNNETQIADETEVTTMEDLEDERVEIQTSLMDRSLTILASFKTENLVFELADLIVAGISKHADTEDLRTDASETLVNSLVSFQDNNIYEVREDVTAYAHLLGLLLQDSALFQTAKDTLKENFGALLSFLRLPAHHKPGDSASWMCNILLIVERVLSEDAQPRKIQWTPPPAGQQVSNEPIAMLDEPLASTEEKETLFNLMLDILPKIGNDAELGLAVARVLLILTRNRRLAKKLGEKRNMARLFLMIRQILLHDVLKEKMQAAIMLTLRHIVEDEESVKQIMRNDIKALFTTQSRAVDAPSYTRHLYHLVLRDPELFVEVTNELLKLPKYDKPHHAPQLALKREEDAEMSANPDNRAETSATESVEIKANAESSEPPEKTKAPEIKPPVVENPDGVIHFLLSELLAYKDVSEKTPPKNSDIQPRDDHGEQGRDFDMSPGNLSLPDAGSAETSPSAATNHAENRKFDAEDHPIFVYRCFILSVLTELLSSYNRTKIEFINFSRRADPQAATPSKPRSGVLNYLLNGLIPQVSLTQTDDIVSEKNAAMSTGAIGVVVALCARTAENPWSSRHASGDSDDEPELLFVRRFVLEHALKAYRDTSSIQDRAEMKYAKLLALADMFNRMLAARQHSPHRAGRDPATAHLVPTQKQLAKIMFEKNFIAALNHSILDIDLRVPGANRAVKYILRPLNLLTQTAIELSLTSEISTSPGQTDEDEISSATSVSDTGEGREETPDLFRNSTLGMFEPNRGQAQSEDSDMSSEGDEEDMYDEAYADDMEFDEQEHAHGEDVVSDEDEEMEGIGPIEGIPGDVPMELQFDLEADDDESIDDDDDDEDESEEDDEEAEDDEDDEIEIMEEVVGDDGASAGEDHDVDEWEDDDGEEGNFADLDDVHDIDDHEESNSENDAEGYPGTQNAMDVLGAATGDMVDPLDEDGLDGDDSDEGDEEDGDDYDDDEDIVFHAEDFQFGDADTGITPFNFWPIGHRHGRHRHHRHQWTAAMNDADSPLPIYPPGYRAYASGRLGGESGRNADDTTNPLLTRPNFDNNPSQNGRDLSMRESNHEALHDLQRLLRRGAVPAPENDGGAMAYISNLLNTIGNTGPVGIQTGANGALSISLGLPSHGFPRHDHHMDHMDELEFLSSPSRGNEHGHTHGIVRNLWATAAFEPVPTTRRWQDEAKLLFGAAHTQKCLNVVSSILRLLIPPAIEAERIRKENEKKVQEEKNRQQAEKEEQERKEREERQAREAAERAEAEAAAARDRAEADTQTAANDGQSGEEMQGIEPTDQPSSTEGTNPSTAEPSRIFTNIRGRQVDITSLGIDVEVLEALPEEMREEVIAQQYVEQRTNARESGEVEEPTSISSEFLDALPPDIREEIIQQEAQERRRREREDARRRSQAAGTAGQPEDMDPASFMASLDPTLRATVLAEADEDMLATLPEDLAAEARALGSHHRRRTDPFARVGSMGLNPRHDDLRRQRANQDQGEEGHAPLQRRPIIQMLDKAGIATLLRLMFVPVTGSARSSLSGILRNACGNRQTRQEVISGLLFILQDGTFDASAAERSFSHLTSRAKQSTSLTKTPPPTRKNLQPPNSSQGSEASAGVAISQCLAALMDLVRYINHVPQFFLAENESFGAARAKASRKGKNKESKSARYPINSLMSLLDRESVINDVAVMEQLASLLSSVTAPLNGLSRKDREEGQGERRDTEAQSDPTAPGSAASAEQDTAMAGTEPSADVSGEATANHEHKPNDTTTEPKKARAISPPEIPEENLRFVVNILAARDCTSKTFRDTLSTMTYLSAIPGARKVLGDELIKQARQLGQTIREKLKQLVKALNDAENELEAQSLALTNFSPTGSDQSKFNRILTALDYLFQTKSQTASNGDDAKTIHEDGKELLEQLHNDDTFIELWQQLGGCLSATQKSEKYFLNVATILLPLIEALMVVCKRIPVPNKSRREEGETQDQTDSKMRAVFFSFTNKHRKVLNDLVRHNPKLMSGSFSVLVKNSGVLEFDNKRNFFNRRLHHRNVEQRHRHHPALPVNVRREQVFLDSYKCLYYKSPEEIKYGKLNIHFHHEEGVDAGGVTREWFQVLARQMFNPDYALFNPVASDRTTFHPNSLSSVNPEHLPFFKFIGRIIGKALYENRVLDCHFSRAVYKRILGNAVSMKDMETIDLDYTKGMEWILHNDISDVITETFSLTQDKFGVEEVIDLIPNGRNEPVTEGNKEEYVKLVTEYKLLGSVKEQLESFLEGFHEIVPAELIAIFDEGELELLISGMPDVDIDDWKTNTEYHSYNASSPQIQWFWRAVRSFDKEERAKLLQFVTGTGKVPLNGFKELEGMNGFTRFSIHKDFGNKDRLPSSHTCFNQLDLPEYDNYETLRKSLYTAMTTGADFFGLI